MVHASASISSDSQIPTSSMQAGQQPFDDKGTGRHAAISHAAASQALMLKSKNLRNIDPDRDLKKLRVLLRNESLEWLDCWISFGGYKALMERLHEVLALEWRSVDLRAQCSCTG